MTSPERFLVPHDFSSHADAALQAAVSLAKALGARVDLVHVYRRPVEVLSPYGVAVPASLEAEIRDTAEKLLAKRLEAVKEAGLEGETAVREGEAAHGIAAEAEARGADLIVMGTHGRTGVKHALLGSVTERTVRTSSCPVLSIKS